MIPPKSIADGFGEILPIPDIPSALSEAAGIGKLIPFIGAGVSRLAGCPGWLDFANGALQTFVDHGKFSHAQLAQIESLSPRVKLSLALALQERHAIRIEFPALLHRQERKDHVNGRRLYAALSRLGKTFVTTNYDEWLDDELEAPSLSLTESALATSDSVPKPRSVYHRIEDLTAVNLNQQNAVLHLHGSVKNPDGMILTTPQYVRHYANDRDDHENFVLTFLQDLFKNKTVLFIGYGLEELEILEYIIVKRGQREEKGLEPKHFLLQGFFSHERELMLSMRTYYRECGIGLLPYLRDQNNWEQLINVVEALARAVPAAAPMVLQEFKEMENLLNG